MGKRPANTDVRFWRDPDIPGVDVRYSSYNEEAFRDHTHDAYSIGMLETGRTTFTLEGASHDAKAGQLVLIPPNAVHACNPDPGSDMSYRMFYVDTPWLETVAAELTGRKSGPPRFTSPVVDDPDLFETWGRVHEAYATGADRLEKESLLVQALADLISRHADEEESPTPPENATAVKVVKAHLAAHLSEKVSLDTLSGVAHVSRYHLLRIFQAEVGLPPHAYQNQLRIEAGKRLLAQGIPIAQAAMETGFTDQSHFSRVFKQFTGATPRQYQTSVETED